MREVSVYVLKGMTGDGVNVTGCFFFVVSGTRSFIELKRG